MQITDSALHKADPSLRDVLRRATGTEIIRTLLTLGATPMPREMAEDGAFGGDRAAYRRRMTEQRERSVKDHIGSVIHELEALDLHPKGGTVNPIVVVEGTTEQISRTLELSGVRHAALDRELTLIEPRKAVSAIG